MADVFFDDEFAAFEQVYEDLSNTGALEVWVNTVNSESGLSDDDLQTLYGSVGNPVTLAVQREIEELQKAVRTRAEDRLHTLLGALVEELEVLADTAAIFLSLKTCQLLAVATVDVNRSSTRIRFEDRGIVPAVARDHTARLLVHVDRDPEYFTDVEETRSELAIPVMTADEELLAVINLEFSQTRSEAQLQTAADQVQSRLGEMVTHLLVLRELYEGGDEAFPWHPEFHNWDAREILTRICHRISDSLDRERTKVTVWSGDVGKDRIHAYATSGGAYAYESLRSLKFWESVLGQHMLQSGDVVCYAPRREDLYPERRSGNFQEEEGWLIVFQPRMTEGPGSLAAVGISCAGRDCELMDRSREWIVKAALAELGPRFADGLARFARLRREITLTQLSYQLRPKSSRRFELLLHSLLTTLLATAGSIFAVPEASGNLECVATTGLLQNQNAALWHGPGLAYDLALDASWTVSVAKRAGKVVRIDRTDDPQECAAAGFPARPQSKFREMLLTDDQDRRRFLACAIMDGPEILGVIRLVRSCQEPPFTLCEERLLLEIADRGATVIRNWRAEGTSQSHPDEVHDVLCRT